MLARRALRMPFYYGWLIVAVAALVSFSEVAFLQPVLGVFMRPLHDEFGWSRATISGSIGVGSLAGAVLSPVVGRVLDRWGGRWVMAGAGTSIALCLFFLAGVQSLVLFYVLYTIGRAAVVSVLGLASSVAVSNWFIRNRGPAIAIMNFGTRLGQAVLPAIVAVMVIQFGWRSGFVALGLIVLLCTVIPSILIVRRRPEDLGLLPDGGSGLVQQRHAADVEEVDWTAGAAVRTRAFWLLTAATSITMMAHSALFLHLISYLQDQGMGTGVAVSVISLTSLVGGLGGLLGGIVQRRIGARRTLSFSLAGQATSLLYLLNVSTLPEAYVFAVYYGLVGGTTIILNSMIFAVYFGRRSLGTIRGIASPFQLFFNAAGPFLGGLSYDLTGSYVTAFAGYAAFYVVAALCMVAANRPTPRLAAAPTATPA
jgi:MFS family permease